MNRRFFIWLLAVMPTVFLAHAQQSAKVRTIGVLGQAGGPSGALEVLRQALRDLGWIEGINIAIENRPDGEGFSLADKVTELVRLKVDVIVTTGGISTRAAQKATTTIPIIFTSSGDPIEGGFIDSLARPGKNLTGVTFLAYELVGKRLELLKEAVPRVSRVAVIANPAHPGEQRELSETQSIARALGITLDHHPVRSRADYDTAFDAILKKRPTVYLRFPRPELWRMLRRSRSSRPSIGFRACSVGRSMSRAEVLWPMDRTGMKLTGELPFMSTRS